MFKEQKESSRGDKKEKTFCWYLQAMEKFSIMFQLHLEAIESFKQGSDTIYIF